MSSFTRTKETHEEFIEKFKPKKTTDDCYTPAPIYDVIREYVCERFDVNPETIVRPFYPGGDYAAEDYDGRVVVDNPPFSIISKIIDFYDEHGVKYFLFSPGLVMSTKLARNHMLITGMNIIYENGARVSTNFVTNIDGVQSIESAPVLREELEQANAGQGEKLPKYIYPTNVLRISDFEKLAKRGMFFKVDNYHRVKTLEKQKEKNKGIFGGGILISDAKAEEFSDKLKIADEAKKIADEADAHVWELSPRERAIVNGLNAKEKDAS